MSENRANISKSSRGGDDAGAKICTMCGKDCSGVPRVRNPAGEYACKSCMTSQVEAQAAKQLAANMAGSNAGGKHKSAVNKRKQSNRAMTCHKCGYDLKGLESNVCPECATVNTFSRARTDWDRETSSQVATSAYKYALVMLAVAGLIGLGLSYSSWGISGSLAYLSVLVASYVIGIGVVLISEFTWMGRSTAFTLLAMQVAAIHCVCITIFFSLVIFKSPVMFWFGLAFVYSIMFERMTDNDSMDSWILGLIVVGVHIAILTMISISSMLP